MMRTVGVSEARAQWSCLLDEVARGETIMITRRGVPVAALTPASGLPLLTDERRAEVKELIDDWRRYRAEQNITLGGLSIREMIEEGRQ